MNLDRWFRGAVLAAAVVFSAAEAHAGTCSGGPAPMESTAGAWKWFNGGTATLNADKTATTSDGARGTWSIKDEGARTVEIRWNDGGFVDTVKLSDDGRELSGTNQAGTKVSATRTADFAAGKWRWSNDVEVTLGADWTAKSSAGLPGCWRVRNFVERKIVINWNNDEFVDLLTVSEDGRTLSGKNSAGAEVSGKKL